MDIETSNGARFQLRDLVGFVGRALITTGILVLLFAGYQLWGTDIYTDRAQADLKEDFAARLAKLDVATTKPGESTSTTSPIQIPTGDAVATLRINKIEVDVAVVNGTSRTALRKGPGHYPETPLPGEFGNAAIAGHRTTYGAPFGRLNEVGIGDEIIIRTLSGKFVYSVFNGPFEVKPTDLSVLDPPADGTAILTLTTCHPKFSAARRLVVQAALVPESSAEPQRPTKRKPASSADGGAKSGSSDSGLSGEGLSGATAGLFPTVVWGFAFVVVGGAWWFAFHRRKNTWVWFVGAVVTAAPLFMFYVHLERVLPGNY